MTHGELDPHDSHIPYDALVARVEQLLVGAGASPKVAGVLARNCVSCERDGALSHGIFRVKGYVASLTSGWADGKATPAVEQVSASYVRVDGANGFTQLALEASEPAIRTSLAETGLAVVAARDSHHFSALWPDLEPYAREGYVSLAMISSGTLVVMPRGTSTPVFGTNPFAFATPVHGAPPLVFDFATASMSHGDLQLHCQTGRSVPVGVGVNRDGQDTQSPDEILDGGGLLPFGGHKGALLSMMIEILAAGLTGGAFSFEMNAEAPPNAHTFRTGQLFIFIDPTRGGNGTFASRVAQLVATLRDAGMSRMPADQRYATRAEAKKRGIPVTQAIRELYENPAAELPR